MNVKQLDKAIRRPASVMLAGAVLGAVAVLSVLLLWPGTQRAFFGSTDREPRAVVTAGNSATDDHDHPGHQEAESIHLSEQARRNIGLRVGRIELTQFERTITVPAMVVDRPGRTEIDVVAPMTGIITRIYALEGEAVRSGEPLFDIRLTHEELVQAQADFLRTAEQLDVVHREIERLEEVARRGAIPGRRVLEQEYEKEKLEAALKAHREALILHGLSQQQVDKILSERTLVAELTVHVPRSPAAQDGSEERLLYIQNLDVGVGQHLSVGDAVCKLADHAELYIEGKAFEQDAARINEAATKDWSVAAVFEADASQPMLVTDLSILYVSNVVETQSRALNVYVRLPNELVRDAVDSDGHRFIGWRFRPGQRLQLRIPVEQWSDRIVLPLDAIAQDGPEFFVFQENGDHFDRRPVHVEYRDQQWAVIASDGSLFPGDSVAVSGAHQMQMALKNKAGGGVDPHAGHNH